LNGSEKLSEKIKPILLNYGKEIAKEVIKELQPKIEIQKVETDYWVNKYTQLLTQYKIEKSLRKSIEQSRNDWRQATLISNPISLIIGAAVGTGITIKILQ
jgi:flagellar biosynthesis chaperone FliJ